MISLKSTPYICQNKITSLSGKVLVKKKLIVSDFFIIVGERIKTYPQIKISRTVEQYVQKAVLMKLGLTNINALRDRYEGQSFLDRNRSRLFSNLAIREHLGEIIKRDSYTLLDENENIIIHNKSRYRIVTAPFGELPLMKNIEHKISAILVFQRDIYSIQIAGVASIEILNNKANYRRKGNYLEFIGFDKIQPL